MNTAKKQATKACSGYRLTHKTLNNLSQFKISATSKLVLIYLTSCYNEKNKYVFPKQSKIADVLGISERTVVRAISELVKESLIIIECKYINHYKFTSKIVSEYPENLTDNIGQDDTSKRDNLTHLYIEPEREQIKNLTNMGDFKILKDYAVKHGAKNIDAYINVLRKNGSANKIIAEHKQIEANKKAMINNVQKDLQEKEALAKTKQDCFDNTAWVELGKKFGIKTLRT